MAVNANAEAVGLRPGMLLTDAMAIAPDLRAVAQDLREEQGQLRRLALWCRRYTPWTAPDEPAGLRLDISGCAHLFGGEKALLRDVGKRLSGAGFACRAAIADTPGAAWAMARYSKRPLSIIPPGEQRAHLAPLPVRGLRIAADKATALEHLGLKTIGQVADLPRPQLRARFGADLCARLDQAFGTDSEALHSLPYETVYRERIDFAEPVSSLPVIELAIAQLLRQLTPRLRDDGKGARGFGLTLFDTQGESADLDLALTRPSHDSDHILRLFRERLSSLEGRFRRDVAFDAATLLASSIETLRASQSGFMGRDEQGTGTKAELGAFVDRLRARLAAQAEIAIEAELERAGFVLEQVVDDRAFARAGGLEEGDLALRLKGDDLAQVIAGDCGFVHDVRGALLHDLATGAEALREKQPSVAGLESQALPGLRAGQRDLARRIGRNGGG